MTAPTARCAAFGHVLRMLKVGSIGFGGGSALIPVMERELVVSGRLTQEEFAQDTVIANITPGALPVKLAATSGARLGGARLAAVAAMAVALPGAVATVWLLSVFSQLGSEAIQIVEFASLGITAFIIYLLAHYSVRVLAPGGTVRPLSLTIAAIAFLASGAGRTVSLGVEVFGLRSAWMLPELSALGLVLVALTAISAVSLVQSLRARASVRASTEPRAANTAWSAVRAPLVLAGLAVVGVSVGSAFPPAAETLGFLGLVAVSTLSSFGGGEAYVGVADGFFVGSGLVESTVFYGQVVPIANALPGPILVKIAAGVAFVQGGAAGWALAGAAVLVTVGACSAVALALLAGYGRASNSLLVKNVSRFILPVICGLLGSTAISMLHSNVIIASTVGIPEWITVAVSLVLAAAVVFLRRAPDILVIAAFSALTCAGLLALSSS